MLNPCGKHVHHGRKSCPVPQEQCCLLREHSLPSRILSCGKEQIAGPADLDALAKMNFCSRIHCAARHQVADRATGGGTSRGIFAAVELHARAPLGPRSLCVLSVGPST